MLRLFQKYISRVVLLGCFIYLEMGVYGQSANVPSPVDFSGYLSEMPSYLWQDSSMNSAFDVLIHNRINLKCELNDHFKAKLEFRNRLFWGESVESTVNFKYFVSADNGVLDLSFNWGSRSNYLLNTTVDRASVEYERDNVRLKVGRQRVNWGQAKIWNPNDIFNSYSYLNFDYVERPVMDGVKFQYLTGNTSNVEAVFKIDDDLDMSLAGIYRFNKLGYDFQFMAGELEQEDLVIGAGWNGRVAGANFYGELSYLSELDNWNDNHFISSVGANYTFENSLLLLGEYLYASNLVNYEGSYTSLMYNLSSVYRMGITDHSYFASLAYPFTSSLNISVAYMGFGFSMAKSFYLAPTVDYYFTDRLKLTGVVQCYHLTKESDVIASYLRLKWQF